MDEDTTASGAFVVMERGLRVVLITVDLPASLTRALAVVGEEYLLAPAELLRAAVTKNPACVTEYLGGSPWRDREPLGIVLPEALLEKISTLADEFGVPLGVAICRSLQQAVMDFPRHHLASIAQDPQAEAKVREQWKSAGGWW